MLQQQDLNADSYTSSVRMQMPDYVASINRVANMFVLYGCELKFKIFVIQYMYNV